MINYEYNLIRKPIDNRGEWKEDCFQWKIKINDIEFDYYTGRGLITEQGNPKPPILDDVLYCLLSDSEASEQSFEDWCNNSGYDTDSRKALNLYLECQETENKLRQACIDINAERKRLEDY